MGAIVTVTRAGRGVGSSDVMQNSAPCDEVGTVRMAVLAWAGGWILLLQGCSGESLERVGYETMRNVKEQQCLNRKMRQCPENLSYEEYQEQRRELEGSGKDEQ
jgi:hypothetical protein